MDQSGLPTLRVAVVGAGPAGIYAADILVKNASGIRVSVDLFERLPAPYGLVRYGVAPDHPRIKAIIEALRNVLDKGDIRLFGDVDFGTDITLEDLRHHYHAVIFATGSFRDAPLDIPGIDLPGSFGAADFVNWYDGHPDVPREWALPAAQVAVIGNGNVALDVTRILAKHAEDLLVTDIPENVYRGLAASKVTDVHVFGRRGPAQSKFTPLELRELGQVRDVDMVLDPRDFDYDEDSLAEIASTNQKKVIDRIYRGWLDREPGHASRRIRMHFHARPAAILGSDHVEGIRVERTSPDGRGGVVGTGVFEDFPVGQVYRAIGYFGSPLPGVPFDERSGIIPNDGGRVLGADGKPLPGMYATGWIKRGPVGLIGSTKSDALETITHLVEDRGAQWQPSDTTEEAIPRLLAERGVRYTTLDGWHRLDAFERALGERAGRERIKLVSREEMLHASVDGARAGAGQE